MRKSKTAIMVERRLILSKGAREVTLSDQRIFCPGATPAENSFSGEGRGAILYDLVNAKGNPVSVKCGKVNQTTRGWTTGTDRHVKAAISSLADYSGPVLWIDHEDIRASKEADISAGWRVRVFRLADIVAVAGVHPASKGQGKQNPHPVRVGTVKRPSGGRELEYFQIALSAPKAGEPEVDVCVHSWKELAAIANAI